MTLGVTGLTSTLSSTAAYAGTHVSTPTPVQIGWTDSAKPNKAYDFDAYGSMPVGTQLDNHGRPHTSRVYATFDLSALTSTTLLSGTIYLDDADPATCAGRDLQLWRTTPISTTPTWQKAPEEKTLVAESITAGPCGGGIVAFDALTAIKDALTHNQKTITFEVRVPAAHEHDPAYGRTLTGLRGVQLSVDYNKAPYVDNAHLYTDGHACTTQTPYPVTNGNMIQAVIVDPDIADGWGETLTTEFALWPVSDPDSRTTYTQPTQTSGRASTERLPSGTLADGISYGWQARVNDGTDTSGWSTPCYFSYDSTAPSAPTVTSPNFPPNVTGPVGVPAEFTFSGNGDTDVAGFQYRWGAELGVPGTCSYGTYGELVCPPPFTGTGLIKADAPGGTATVDLVPQNLGLNQLVVRSLDEAGNVSSTVSYEIFAPNNSPSVEVVGGTPQWNQKVELKFTPAPGVTGVTSYDVVFANGDNQTVQAATDGTALFDFVASNVDGINLTVRSVSATFTSPKTNYQYAFDPWPGVTSDVYVSTDDGSGVGGVGVPGTFTFTPPPGMTDVSSYQYRFTSPSGDSTSGTVQATAERTATLDWTPTQSGSWILDVYAVASDGSPSSYDNWYFFIVA